MNANLSNLDRMARVIIAIVVGVLYFMNVINGLTAIILGAISVIFIITSAVSFCPIYAGLKISTKK